MAGGFKVCRSCCSGGSPCGSNPIKVCCVNLCNGGQPATGVEVEIKSGSTVVASCTTDSTGCCTFPSLPPGSYTVVTTNLNPRYQATTHSTTLSCGTTYTITLSAASGYFCSPCFNEPIPTHLTATVNGTPFTLLVNVPASFYPSNTFANTINPSFTTLCPPDPTPNPCTTGGTAYALITVAVDTSACEVTQYWCQATDCTQVAANPCPSGPFSYILGEDFFSEGSGEGACDIDAGDNPNPQWNEGVCEGICSAGADAIATIGTGNPVPVNLSLTFTSLTGSPSPPFPTMTLTE